MAEEISGLPTLKDLSEEKQSAIAEIENLAGVVATQSEESDVVIGFGLSEEERKEVRDRLVQLGLEPNSPDLENVHNVLRSFLMAQDIAGEPGVPNEILREHAPIFMLYFLRLYPELKAISLRYGYHKLDFSNPENVGHIINHTMAGVANLCLFRALARGEIKGEDGTPLTPEQQVAQLLEFVKLPDGETADDADKEKEQAEKLLEELRDPTKFNEMIRTQVLTSLIHDIEERDRINGRKGHEARAQRRATVLAAAGKFEPARLLDIVTGIQGSIVTGPTTPKIKEEVFYGDNLFVSAAEMNTVKGRFHRTLTKICDWEALTAPVHRDTAFFEQIERMGFSVDSHMTREQIEVLAKIAATNTYFCLVAEGLNDEGSDANRSGNGVVTGVYNGNVWAFLKGYEGFYNGVARRQSAGRDQLLGLWKKTANESAVTRLWERLSCSREKTVAEVHGFQKTVAASYPVSLFATVLAQLAMNGKLEKHLQTIGGTTTTMASELERLIPAWWRADHQKLMGQQQPKVAV